MTIRTILAAALAIALCLVPCAPCGTAEAAAVIGWGDEGHSFTGVAWSDMGDAGWNSGENTETSSDTSNTSTWEFTGLADGDYYVAASWTSYDAFPVTSTAQYDISDGGGTVVVDQHRPLRPFNAEGFGWWNQLSNTPVSVTDGTLSVTLSDPDLGAWFFADAIRISSEPMGDPNVFIIDSNSAAGYSTTGTWGSNLFPSGTSPVFAGDVYWQSDPFSAAETATWSFRAGASITGVFIGERRGSSIWEVVHRKRSACWL